MRRILVLVLALGLVAAVPATTGADAFPDRIPLPAGIFPEGIAVGRGATAYVGSLADGRIVELDLVDGTTEIFAPSPGPGRIAVGLDVDRRGRVWVAGGGAAQGGIASVRAYDTRSGELVYQRDVAAGFVNDVIVTKDAAWFTDSFGTRLIRVPLQRNGSIGEPEYVEMADFELAAGFNANGITATPNGKTLIVAQSDTPAGDGGALYAMPADPDASVLDADRIEIDGTVPRPDGLVLQGHTLYAVSGDPQAVTVVRLSPHLDSGTVVDTLSVPGAVTPTTAALFGKRLYVVDAKFALGGGPELSYEIIAISR